MDRVFPFTFERILKAIAFARGSSFPRWVFRDESKESPHLHLIVGRRSAAYYHRSRSKGQEKTVRLGDAEGPARLTLSEARDRCNAIKYGVETRASKKSKTPRIGYSTDHIWNSYLKEVQAGTFSLRGKSKRPLSEKTVKGYASNYNAHLKAEFGPKDFGVFLATIVAKLREISASSPALGNQVLATATNLVEFSRRRDFYDGPNPLKAENADLRGYVKGREVRLKEKEIASLVKVLDAQPEYWRSLFFFLSLTGNRLQNASRLAWDQVDFEAKVIIHEADTMKAGKAVADPITEEIQTLLETRKAQTGDSPWVWPQSSDQSKPLRNPHRKWDQIRKEAGLPKLRIHDLKHLAISWADAAKVPSRAVQKFGKHGHAATTARYSHLDPEAQIPAVEAVSEVWSKARKSV